MMIKRVRIAKRQLEENPLNVDIKRALEGVQRDHKVNKYVKMMSKYDIQSLIDTEKTIDTLMDKRS